MRKIYKIAQYNNIAHISNTAQQSSSQQFRTMKVRRTLGLIYNHTPSSYNNNDGIDLPDYTDLNQEFNTEEEAIAVLASYNFTNEQLRFFEIVVQIRVDEPVTPKSELEAIKEIMPEDSPEWAKRLVALLEKQTNAKDSL